MVTVVMAGAESSSDFSSSIRGTAGTSDDKSFRIFLQRGNIQGEAVKHTLRLFNISLMHLQTSAFHPESSCTLLYKD